MTEFDYDPLREIARSLPDNFGKTTEVYGVKLDDMSRDELYAVVSILNSTMAARSRMFDKMVVELT